MQPSMAHCHKYSCGSAVALAQQPWKSSCHARSFWVDLRLKATLLADDATSPPPMGLTGFARKASREPFAALQLHAKRPQAAAYLEACEKGSQGSAGLKGGISSSLPASGSMPVATTKQARSKCDCRSAVCLLNVLACMHLCECFLMGSTQIFSRSALWQMPFKAVLHLFDKTFGLKLQGYAGSGQTSQIVRAADEC